MSDTLADAQVFVDSNVLVYAYDSSNRAKHERARTLVDELWREERGHISIQVLQEFFVTIRQKVIPPVPLPEARRIVVNLGRWKRHEPTVVDVVEAIDIQRSDRISFWDAMIVRSASVLGCDVLCTEDLNDGQSYRSVRVSNPFT